jgi:hypothetical protein
MARLELLWHMVPLSAGTICQTRNDMIDQVHTLVKEDVSVLSRGGWVDDGREVTNPRWD